MKIVIRYVGDFDMTKQARKHYSDSGSFKKVVSIPDSTSQNKSQIELFAIAVGMKTEGLSEIFILDATRLALEYEGIADLMRLWKNEEDLQEREEIVADIQDMINTCSKKEKAEEVNIKFNDLRAIAKNIRSFKDNLLQVVVEHGGISCLAALTGIPQPSLSRFFNSNAMPHRATLLKIAKALKLDAVKIDSTWSKN